MKIITSNLSVFLIALLVLCDLDVLRSDCNTSRHDRYDAVAPVTIDATQDMFQGMDYKDSRDVYARLAPFREFVWTHWANKALGRIEVIFVSIEGNEKRTVVYVEPDSHCKWRIRLVETTNTGVPTDAGMKRKRQKSVFYGYSVGRIQTDGIVLSDSARVSAEEFRLQIGDGKSGARTF